MSGSLSQSSVNLTVVTLVSAFLPHLFSLSSSLISLFNRLLSSSSSLVISLFTLSYISLAPSRTIYPIIHSRREWRRIWRLQNRLLRHPSLPCTVPSIIQTNGHIIRSWESVWDRAGVQSREQQHEKASVWVHRVGHGDGYKRYLEQSLSCCVSRVGLEGDLLLFFELARYSVLIILSTITYLSHCLTHSNTHLCVCVCACVCVCVCVCYRAL